MGTEGKAFNEVRAILGRLDRSIDAARARRVGPAHEEPEYREEPVQQRAPAPEPTTPARPAPLPPGVAPTPARRSQYGRAKPLRNGEEAPPARPTDQWQRPKPNYDDNTMIG